MFASEWNWGGHTKRLTITTSSTGWEVREEHDSRVVRIVNYADWHRVERARQLFELAQRETPLPPQ